MHNTTARLMLALLIGSCLAIVGCESDDDGVQNADVVGTWSGRYTGGKYQSATVTLNADGTMSVTTSGGTQGFGQYSVSGSNITMTVGSPGSSQIVIWTGTVSTDGNAISGTWADNKGRAGTFTLTRQ